ncbi:glycosyl hydrolase [uncultured Sulfitobacter sp.]|uniref:glycosyl hydrolase n=1 Tax=Sulfitobacter sp. SH22 TaxID=3421172 RepID=UPI0025E8FD68|nr:glycosyl hydrolase [uncultured Sulfitobacter sp.]
MTMARKVSSFVGALILMAQAAVAQSAGVGAWENPSYTTLEWIESQRGLGWYYNWRADEIWQDGNRRRSVEFVPMIHTAANIDDQIRSSRKPSTLLGFNEPDGHGGSHQAGMSVQQAVALWPRLEASGLRLGSPATTQEGALGQKSWQRNFMNEVERRGLRVDFMAVHYYSKNGDVAAFRKWLIAVHKEYRRPIWVTEFAFIDWSRPGRATYQANARFAQAAVRMLDDLPFVERYAWFAANPYPWKGKVPAINLVDNKMRPTPVGAAYAEAISAGATVTVASLAVQGGQTSR